MGAAAYAGYLIKARMGPEMDPNFLFYFLQSDVYWQWVESIFIQATIQNISAEKYANLHVPVPPRSDQSKLIDQLDRETKWIDGLIEKKYRLLERLEEKLQSAIMTEIGKIGGKSSRLKFHVKLLPGYAFSSAEFSDDPDHTRLLRGINISTKGIRWDDVVRWNFHDRRIFERFSLKAGDIVFGMDRPWIGAGVRVAQITKPDLPCLLLQRVACLRPYEELRSDYLELLLRSKHFFAHFEPELTGVSVPHISGDQILSYPIALPSIEDQASVAEVVRKVRGQIELASSKVTDAIMKLGEYRRALITSVIVGKSDVRGSAVSEAAA